MDTARVKRRKLLVEVIAISGLCIVMAYILVAMGALKTPAKSHRITFRIEASGGFAMITFSGGLEQIKDATYLSTPWEKQLNIATNTQVYLTGGNPSQSGSVTCILSMDGRVWKKQKADFPVDHVACAGLVP
jgi:hypothetical protein